MSFSLPLFLVILYGVLAAACPGVLEGVEARRLRSGWGLSEPAGAGVLRLGLEDCAWLGHRALVFVEGRSYPAYVVDCQQRAHRLAQPMSKRGIVADVDDERLNHRPATVVVLR